ncbi:hypothetical protein, partial [Micrococcus flavus]|uniref:hypothetical protein n=1 Tax=Micrococcus flavus TaxID=384602 RepID=UPI001E560AE3
PRPHNTPLETPTRTPLPMLICEGPLYYAHLVAEDKLGLYVDAPSPVRTLFTSWPQDPAAVLRMIAEATSGEVVMFGLHRNRLSQLTEEQRNAVTSMWHQDLLKPWEQGDWFMEQ